MGPRQFFFTPTYICDEECLMCGVPLATRIDGATFSRPVWQAEIDRMRLRSEDILTLSGGEPLVAPDLRELIQYAVQNYGCRVSILSNGRRLRNPAFADSLVGIGITKFVIPIFSHRPEVHEAITQRPRSFEHTWAGLRNLHARGLKFHVKFIATKLNHVDARETYVRCKQEFPDCRFVFSGLTIFGEAVTNASAVSVRYADVAPSLDLLLAEAESRGDLVPVFIYPLCHVDPVFWHHYNVAKFEEVVVAPDRRDSSDGRTLAEGPKPSACGPCLIRTRCVFAWKPAYHDLYGDSEFKPVLLQ